MTKLPRSEDEALHRAINDWEERVSLVEMLDQKLLRKHIVNEYGIDIGHSAISESIIVDEQKHLVFVLRWS
jgi:hypothetical protein